MIDADNFMMFIVLSGFALCGAYFRSQYIDWRRQQTADVRQKLRGRRLYQVDSARPQGGAWSQAPLPPSVLGMQQVRSGDILVAADGTNNPTAEVYWRHDANNDREVAGAVDFLTKPIDNLRLIAAIDQALRRDAELRLARAFRHIIQQRFETLTPRERQVMEHVIRGRLNKQIAAEIGIGEKTVKIHRGRLMSKMAVRSVAALVHLGVRLGLVAFPLRVMHWNRIWSDEPRKPNLGARKNHESPRLRDCPWTIAPSA